MTSTRNINIPSDYILEKKYNSNIFHYNLYNNSSYGTPFNQSIPNLGIIPSHMSNNVFSNNPTDIESALLGINSNNLVNPQKPVNPELRNINYISFFKRLPIIMPETLIVNTKERPFPIPN